VLTVLDQLRRFQENRDADSPAGAPTADAERDVMSPRIELRHMRSFLAVAEHGSLGRAAEVIGVTQPALSRQMRELEYDVGVALFSRESRGMEITPAGETFREDVGDVLSVVDKIPREIGRAGRAQEQRCVIAVVPHPAVDAIVARVVSELEARDERVRVGTRTIMSTQQADALHACEVDIAVGHAYPVANPPLAGPHVITIPLSDDRISAVLLPKSHPLAAKSLLRADDLTDMPFVWTSREFHPAFYDALFSELAAAGIRPRIAREFEGLATIWSMVLTGAGWTLGWKSHLDEPPPGLQAVPLADFDLPWGVVMAYRQDEAQVPVLETVDAIIAHARQFSIAKAPESALVAGHTPKVRIS
jgi:DNA-binding transcriptional LysR family regulator